MPSRTWGQEGPDSTLEATHDVSTIASSYMCHRCTAEQRILGRRYEPIEWLRAHPNWAEDWHGQEYRHLRQTTDERLDRVIDALHALLEVRAPAPRQRWAARPKTPAPTGGGQRGGLDL